MRRIERENQRALWENKKALRAVYEDYYDQILRRCGQGHTLEIGVGVGNLKEYMEDLLSIDVVMSDWVDVVTDAQALPFRGESFTNVVAVDVLHHVARPVRMLRECARVLSRDGVLILLEPAITPLSWLFYRFMHPERTDLSIDPLGDDEVSDPQKPDDANQAVATLLSKKYAERFKQAFPELEVSEECWLSILVYPLSGGFRRWSLIPAWAIPRLLAFERRLCPMAGRWLGFRLLLVMRKRASADFRADFSKDVEEDNVGCAL